MASTPGLKHGLYWWEARAITTAPALSPCKSTLSTKCHYLEGAVQDKKKKSYRTLIMATLGVKRALD